MIANWIDAFRPADGPPPRTLIPFLRWSMSGAWPMLILAMVISGCAGISEVFTALIIGRVIDGAVNLGPAGFMSGENIGLIIGALAFFLILRPAIFGLSAAMNAIMVGPNLRPLVLSRLHRYSLGQPVTFFDNDFAGRIAQKQTQTATAVTQIATEVINVVAFAIASLIGSVALLVAINWWIGLMLCLWMVGYVALLRYFIPRVRQQSKIRAGASAMVTGQVVDTITNIKTVKLFAHSDREDRAALGAMARYRDTALGFGYLAAIFRFSLLTLAGVLPVLLIGSAVVLWSWGQASAGDIAAAAAIATRIAQMTGWVSFTLMAIYSHVGEAEDGMKTLTPAYALQDKPRARDLRLTKGELSFRNVTFAYGAQGGGVFDVDLTIKPGEKIGIVGASGAGKSTLVNLALRLYDPEQGRVLIDGEDISHVTQSSLRQQIGMVTQDTAMFNRSARDNILYGDPNADEAQMIHAAQQARVDDFINGLQDHKGRQGYDAFLGERGVKLSGGQRQRIALARAILKDAPILILDEATSALDSEVEAQIQAALDVAMQGKTVLAIAHRLSTIASMDRIIVLEQGRIVEQGTHQDLLARGGVYTRYWNRQSGGFIATQDAAE